MRKTWAIILAALMALTLLGGAFADAEDEAYARLEEIGVYDGDPADPSSKVIRTVRMDDGADRFVQPSRSSSGRGGMQSKFRIASRLAGTGTRVIIANGTREHILTDLLSDPEHTIHTEFIPE